MAKQGKKYLAAAKQVQVRPYSLEEAVPLVQKLKFTKFDETVELHLRLGVVVLLFIVLLFVVLHVTTYYAAASSGEGAAACIGATTP